MKKSNITQLVSIAFLLVSQLTIAHENWKPVKSKNGIVVSQIQGTESKNVDSKVEFVVNRSADDIIGYLINFNGYTKWNSNCTQSKLVKKIDDSNWIYYTVFSAPFIQDRELYAKVSLQTIDKKNYKMHIEACPKIAAANSKFVRISNFYCDYTLEKSGNNKTFVIVTTSLDMAGNLSPSMVNKFSSNSLLNTFTNLCSQLNY